MSMNALRTRLEAVLTELNLEGEPFEAGSWVWEESNTLWASVVDYPEQADAEDGPTVEVQLELQLVGRDDPDAEAYVVCSWVVVPPDRMAKDWQNKVELLLQLNIWNREPGVKFRIDGEGADVSLVLETEIAAAAIPEGGERDSVQRLLDHSLLALATYFDEIESQVL